MGASQGRLEAGGSLEKVDVLASGTLPVEGRPFELEVDASVGKTGAQIRTASFAGQGMSLALGGEASWRDGLSLDLVGEARGLNPEIFVEDYPASIDVQISAVGTDESLEIRLAGLEGHLLERPLQGEGNVLLENFALSRARLDLESGESRIEVEAPSWPEEPIRAHLDLANLGDLLPDLAGTLQGDAKVVPHAEGLEIETSLAGSALSFQEWSVSQITTQASLDLRPGGDLVADLAVSSIEGPLAIETVRLQARGRDRKMDFETTISSEVSGIECRGHLDFAETPRLRLDRLDLDTHDFGEWKLTEATTVVLEEGRPHLDPPACLGGRETRICVDVPDSDGVPGRLLLERFPLALLDNLASAATGQEIRLLGELEGDFTWQLVEGRPAIDGKIGSDGIEIAIGSPEGPPQKLVLDSVDVSAQGERDLDLQLRLVAQNGEIGLQGQVLEWTDPEKATLDLRVDADLPDIGEFALFVPGLEDLAGAVEARVTARGNLKKPQLAGQARLSSFALFVPAAGLRVQQGDLELGFDEQGDIAVEGRLDLGEGFIEIEGQGQPVPLRAQLSVNADRAPAAGSSRCAHPRQCRHRRRHR